MRRSWDKFKQFLESYVSGGKHLGESRQWNAVTTDDSNKFYNLEILKSTPIYPLICDLIKSETKRSPTSLSIFLGVNEEDFPVQIITSKLQELAEIYTKSGRPVQVFADNWFDRSNYSVRSEREFGDVEYMSQIVASLFIALNTESVLILDVYPDYDRQSLDIHTGYWQKNWQTYTFSHQHLNFEALNPVDLPDELSDDSTYQKQQELSWLVFREYWLELFTCWVEIFVSLQLDRHYLNISGALSVDTHTLPPLLPRLLSNFIDYYFPTNSDPNSQLSSHKTEAKIEDIERLIGRYYLDLYQNSGQKTNRDVGSDRAIASTTKLDYNSDQNIYLLDLAESLEYFQDKSLAKSQIIQFMENWLRSRNIEFDDSTDSDRDLESLVDLIQPALQLEDWSYMKKLNTYFTLTNLDCRLTLMNILSKQEFEFTVLRMNAQGQIRRSRSSRAKFFCQPLDFNLNPDPDRKLNLEMVYVPSGILRMGSPQTEVGHETNESPMHWVAIPTFFMGKFPVTQAQWLTVAKLPCVHKHLEHNPSEFKGDNRPVENVSWHDAVEFCDRLTFNTGIQYRLPSEAEWEYACRAGTKSPFHFGETMTSAIANYDGTYPYGFGAKGEYRQATTDVGGFDSPNDYGLCDMHGQVLEWCEDNWHDNYKNAPADGKSWHSNEIAEENTTQSSNQNSEGDRENYRVLRGGSWFNVAGRCRSASRHRYGSEVWLNHVGFRVALSL